MAVCRLGKIFILLPLFSIGLEPLIDSPAKAQASIQPQEKDSVSNVLVLHSYNPEFFWTKEIKEGIDQSFQKIAYKTTIFHEFLDAKRYPNLHHKDSFLEGIRDKYQHTDLDLLMVADDPGLNLVLQVHQEYFEDLPVVFMGINHMEEKFLNKSWLTGVFETHSVAETIVEAKRQTGVNHIIFITDSSETGEANRKRLGSLNAWRDAPENIHFIKDITSAEIESKIGSYPDNWPIFVGGHLRKENARGPLISFDEGTEMLHALVPNPIYTETHALLGRGTVGGKVLDGNYHAQQAVQLAERLLSGASPETVEPILEAKNQWIFDAAELENAKISLDDLPPDSILINERLLFYEQYAEIVWPTLFILGISFITIAVLSHAIRRQKNAESKLRANEKQLEQKIEHRTTELREVLESLQKSKAESEERSRELSKKNDELEKSRRFADQANQAKSDFLAKMSHELRTPLNSMLGFTQLLRGDATLPNKHQNYIATISSSGSHLLNLINNILDLSKIQAGKSKLNKKDFYIEALLKSVCQMLELEANKKGILLSCHCEPGFPDLIHHDESKYKQILINVLANAVKFTAYGQVSLRAEALASNQLKFSIRDTGPGIAPQDLEILFEPFSQAEEGKLHGKSTGLGLSISAEFIKLMGGTIEVESEIGKGSLFTIVLPYEKAKNLTNHDHVTDVKPSLRLTVPPVPKKILVVDDDPPTRNLFVELLNRSGGFEVKTAVNGQEAIALSHEWHPDAILMDVQMPIMNGLEAAEIIKQEVKPLPTIIMLTTDTQAKTKKVAIAAGCDSFLNKPCSIDDLLQELVTQLDLQLIEEASEASDSEPSTPEAPLSATAMTADLSQSLAGLPQPLLRRLAQAAASLNNLKLDNVLDDLPAGNELLIAHLSSLKTNFRYDLILTMLEPYLEEGV